MKTKIIYISGNEVFEMADIRAAFDEVRAALDLGSDTVLFGVPVDNDDALARPAEPVAEPVVVPVAEPVAESVAEPVAAARATEPETTIVSEPVATEPVATEPVVDVPEIIEKPKRKTRGRPAKAPKAVAPDQDDVVAPTDVTSDQAAPVVPVASILSVLKSKPDDDVAPAPVAPDVPDENVPAITDTADTIDAPDVAPVAETVTVAESVTEIAPVVDDAPISDVTDDTIADMISDDAPDAPVEKTLEQLLESMTPLCEDRNDPATCINPDEIHDEISMPDDAPVITDTDADTDATLEQLATEFAENQDKIPAAQKNEGRGKIGKLKNILPFKKARRDDTGLMGDLFGWAGIAANDDDFSMPGFFTGVASKK